MRDERRERDKYARASLREQVGDELAHLSRNRPLMWLLAAIVGGWLVLTVTQPKRVVVGDLATGDCIYIHAADADTATPTGRAIGSDGAVILAVFRLGAEMAPCDASHGHEVAGAWVLDDALTAPYPGQSELSTRELPRCEAAFEAYVGRPVDGSGLALTVAIPPPGAWEEGARVAVCLVSNKDGSFLTTHAKGSGA